jgi:rare lipoprotein A
MASIQITSKRGYALAVLLAAGTCLAACATPQPRLSTRLPDAGVKGAGGYKLGNPYQVGGVWYVPKEDPRYDVRGVASWYGDQFHLKPTANGETFDMYAVTGAHTTLPLPSIVEVTNLDNGRKLNVRINDRGPFVGGRVIDLSHEAARQLGYDRQGLTNVRVRYVGPAPLNGDRSVRYTQAPRAQAPQVAPPPVTQMTQASPYRAPYAGYADGADQMSLAPRAPIVAQAALPPVVSAPIQVAAAPAPVAAPRVTIAAPSVSRAYRIQAGAFGDAGNAERALETLASAGADAVVETVDQNGETIYRVMVQAANDPAKAYALREMVAGYGFFDARVVGPY